ncbi:hypothetical protein BGZ65_001370 [Modicella reniformis]|uniref:Uncharacterized protein n=1 Tax=Modicella reniformis TaxID=1440133 RepID=A0A9P6MJC7_9FUNG|nr:hypothetical protein BGZ65_001370 [Modicella reniformis]
MHVCLKQMKETRHHLQFLLKIGQARELVRESGVLFRKFDMPRGATICISDQLMSPNDDNTPPNNEDTQSRDIGTPPSDKDTLSNNKDILPSSEDMVANNEDTTLLNNDDTLPNDKDKLLSDKGITKGQRCIANKEFVTMVRAFAVRKPDFVTKEELDSRDIKEFKEQDVTIKGRNFVVKG